MKVMITTSLDQTLLDQAKKLAKEQGFRGTNAIIEKALALYFSSILNEVWEKSLPSGWIKKLTIHGDSILYENIKCRKTMESFKQKDYKKEILEKKGWKKV